MCFDKKENVMKNRIKNILLVMIIIGFQNNYVQASEELMEAIDNKDLTTVNSLIATGVDVNDKINNFSPLLYAISQVQSNEMVDALIKAGANVNDTGNLAYGDDPQPLLCLAVEMGNKDLVQRLVEAGADIHAEDEDGRTALDIANKNKNRSIARYLMSKGAIALHY